MSPQCDSSKYERILLSIIPLYHFDPFHQVRVALPFEALRSPQALEERDLKGDRLSVNKKPPYPPTGGGDFLNVWMLPIYSDKRTCLSPI